MWWKQWENGEGSLSRTREDGGERHFEITRPLPTTPPGPSASAARAALSTKPPAHETSSLGSFLVDERGIILAFDRNVEKLTGWEATEVVGRSKNFGFYEDKGTLAAASARPLYDGDIPHATAPSVVPLTLHRKDGVSLDVESLVRPLDEHGTRFVVEVHRVVARLGGSSADRSANDLDEITGLPGARTFFESLHVRFAAAAEAGRPLSLLLIDVDRRDAILREHGEEVWRRILERVAGILRATLRPGDELCKLEGRTFAAICESAGRSDTRHLGGQIRRTVENFDFAGPEERGSVRTTVSIGVACFPAEGRNPEELLRRSREALVEAHRLGSNRVWCYVRRPRVHVATDVWFDSPNAPRLGRSRDLSNSGIFVETNEPLPIDMRLGLAFHLPGQNEAVHVIGRVARCEASESFTGRDAVGLGIEFERYTDADRFRLETFLHTARIDAPR